MPVVVPRLNLVEVTAFVASLVHVMLESPSSPSSSSSSSLPPIEAVPEGQQPPVGAGSSEKQAAKRQTPPLCLCTGVFPPTGAAHHDGEKRGEPVVKNDARAVANFERADGKLPCAGVGAAHGGSARKDAQETNPSAAAAEWLLEEAARRLVAHEFTETFK